MFVHVCIVIFFLSLPSYFEILKKTTLTSIKINNDTEREREREREKKKQKKRKRKKTKFFEFFHSFVSFVENSVSLSRIVTQEEEENFKKSVKT